MVVSLFILGSTKWNDFNSINPPVRFNGQNIPVYVNMDSVNRKHYVQNGLSVTIITSNELFQISEVSGYSGGGIYDINVSEINNFFTGQTQIITKSKRIR